MKPIDIRHIRLTQQHLSTTTLTSPVDVVKSQVAVQAQDYYGAKWAIGQRMLNATDEKVEQAITDGSILRVHVMRPTWHFVVADDIRWLVKLTAPRVNAISSYHYRKAELDQATFRKTNKILIKTLQGGKHLTRDELREAVKRGGVEPGDSMRLGYIMHRSELDGILCSGPRKGNQFTYALLDERVPKSRILETDEALSELTLRYFASRGPATTSDFVWWSGLTAAQAKRGIDISSDQLKSEEVDGKTYWMTSSPKANPRQSSRQVHLLPSYDEYFIAYKDRSAAIPEGLDQKALAAKVAFESPLTIDGQVIGTWKRVTGKSSVTIRVTPFFSLSKADQSGVVRRCKEFAQFLQLDPKIEWLGFDTVEFSPKDQRRF